MRKLVWIGISAALAGCTVGGRVSPVRSGSMAMNSEVTGVLAPTDARLNDGSVYQAWRFRGRQGQMVLIEVMSSAFDAYAILEGPGGNEIDRDDDSGEGQNARISVALPVTGSYRIIANTYTRGQFGPYTLRLSETGGRFPRGSGSGQITVGQVVTAQLTSSSPVDDDGRRFALWTFVGDAGQAVQLDMQSTDLDSYLILQDQNGNELQRNDDGGEGLNSRITYTLPYSGMYRLLAMSYRTSGAMFGPYTLSVASGGMYGQPMGNTMGIVGTVVPGQTVEGNLTPMDARYDGKPFQAYRFRCIAGQAFQMDVYSGWDNYALVFDPMGNVVARDDDTGGGRNARLVYACTISGVYRLAVTVFSTSTTPGVYTLSVR